MKKLITLTVLLLIALVTWSQEQRDTLLIPKDNCLSDDEEIEVILSKEEVFGLYSHLTEPCPKILTTYFDKSRLAELMPSDTGRALIAKLSPKGKDTSIYKHSISHVMVGDYFVANVIWMHTPLKRRERKDVEKEVTISLSGQEILALFNTYDSNESHFKPRLFKLLRQNYCSYASLDEVKKYVKYYQLHYSGFEHTYIKL